MDSTLILKQKVDDQSIKTYREAKPFLDESDLFKQLLSKFELTGLNLLHRLIELSEIPFSYMNESVQLWRDQLADGTFCGDGFSLSGKADDLLACYNAMITSVLIKLNYHKTEKIESGIHWILKYQNTERNQENLWKGKGILKYGGCMKSAPCFIGVVKSMIALSDYKYEQPIKANNSVDHKLNKGLEYILDHEVYKRKSNNSPVTKDITKLTYPFTYKTNLIEILRLLKRNGLIKDSRCSAALEALNKKQKKDGSWYVNRFYLPKGWIEFDKPNESGKWISYEIKKLLN
ncbi:MAG: hypothetical protein MI975_20475 [Cytophagales bacterium]|nr:hypothetical protein [Cytophagales bacterium]